MNIGWKGLIPIGMAMVLLNGAVGMVREEYLSELKASEAQLRRS